MKPILFLLPLLCIAATACDPTNTEPASSVDNDTTVCPSTMLPIASPIIEATDDTITFADTATCVSVDGTYQCTAPASDEIEFRGGPGDLAWYKVIPTTYSVDELCKLESTCPLGNLTVSASARWPINSTTPWVLGIGASMMADAATVDCLADAMDNSGAIDYPVP